MGPTSWQKDQAFETKSLGNFSATLTWSKDQRLGAKKDKLPCGSTGTSSGNCQETETCMIRPCHTLRQPLQNHPSWHLGGLGEDVVGRGNAGWTTSKSGQAFPCQNCLQLPPAEKKKKKWTRIFAELSRTSPRRPNRSRDWTELNYYHTFDVNPVTLYMVLNRSCTKLILTGSVQFPRRYSTHAEVIQFSISKLYSQGDMLPFRGRPIR